MNPTHDWKCVKCGRWSPDREEITRCVHCQAHRPDIAEYRKATPTKTPWKVRWPALAVRVNWRQLVTPKLDGPDVLWVCEGCDGTFPTTQNFCAECGYNRSVLCELRTRRTAAMPWVGIGVGLLSFLLLWAATNLGIAAGVVTLIACNNMIRGR